MLRAFDRAMQLQRAAPEILVAESIAPEDVPALLHQLFTIAVDRGIMAAQGMPALLGIKRQNACQHQDDHEGKSNFFHGDVPLA